MDEVRKNRVNASDIKGVLLPGKLPITPLIEATTIYEERKPIQEQQYIKRTIQHINDLGGQVDEATHELLLKVIEQLQTVKYLDNETLTRVEKSLMLAYKETLVRVYRVDNPTVAHVLKIIFDRTKTNPEVYTYTDDQKIKIAQENAKIRGMNYNRRASIHSTNIKIRIRVPDVACCL